MFSFLRRFCPTPERPTIAYPGVKTLSEEGTPRVDISIRQSKQLTENNGRIPEDMAALYIGKALSGIGFGYTIRYNHPVVDPPEERSHCDGDAHDWYKTVIQEWPNRGSDTNVFLTNSPGGGCGQWWDEMVATCPAKNLSERREWLVDGRDGWHSNIQSILHEVGHTLGAHHDHDKETEGNQHPGQAWIDAGQYHYTPTAYNTGGPNRCGDDLPEPPEGIDKVRVHRYSECAKETFLSYLQKRGD